MRPKGIWIAIGLILAVGISSTRLVRQYTSEPLRTKAAETVMEKEVPEIAAFSAGLEQEESLERTVRIPEAAMEQLKVRARSGDRGRHRNCIRIRTGTCCDDGGGSTGTGSI